MEAPLIYPHSHLIPPCQQLFFVLVVPQSHRTLEFLKLKAKRFSNFLLFILFPQQLKDNIEGKLDSKGLFLSCSLSGRRVTLSLMIMQLS